MHSVRVWGYILSFCFIYFLNSNKLLTDMHRPFVVFVTIWLSLGKQVHCALEKCYPEGPFKEALCIPAGKKSLNVFHSFALKFWYAVITSIAGKKKVIFLIVLLCRPVSLGKYHSLLYRQLSYFRCRYIIKSFLSDRLPWSAIFSTWVRVSFYFPCMIKYIPYLPLFFVHL